MSAALLKFARLQECTLRLIPYCNHSPETVVACHLPFGGRGMGMKAPPWWTVHACSNCHDVIDGRVKHELTKLEIAEAMLRALHETWRRYEAAGFITIKGQK